MSGQYILVYAIIGIILIFVLYIFLRFKRVVNQQYTYIVIDDNGFKKVLAKSGVIWNPFEKILRGNQAPDIQYTTIDSSGKSITRHLLDKNTGKLNLRVQAYTLKFPSETTDRHKFNVISDITFNLDPGSLQHTIRLEDFGHMLKTRVESVFSEEISKRQDQDIFKDMEEIRKEVLRKLQIREENRQNLGITVTDSKFVVTEQQIETQAPQGYQPSLQSEGEITEHTLSRFTSVDKSFLQKGMITRLDRMRDLLSTTNETGLNALLQIMEMETRQNIAEALVGSGSLMILSTEDLGLTGGAILEEPLRSHFSKSKINQSNREVNHTKTGDETEEITAGNDGSDFGASTES